MTKILCSILLYASKLKLIYRSFKSLKHFELLSDESASSPNEKRSLVSKRTTDQLSCQEYDLSLSRLDWEVLVLWSLMGVHHFYVALKIEAILSAFLPFYFILKMAFLICTFLVPNTRIPSFLLFSIVVPAINEAHLYVNQLIENDPWKIPLFILDLMWPGTLYPTCKPEDVPLILKHQDIMSIESSPNSNVPTAVKMKALRWKQIKESSSSLKELDKTNEKISDQSDHVSRPSTPLSKEPISMEQNRPASYNERSFPPFKIQNEALLDSFSDDDSLSAWQRDIVDSSDDDQSRQSSHGMYSKNSPLTDRKINGTSRSLRRFSVENEQFYTLPSGVLQSPKNPEKSSVSRSRRKRTSIGDRLKTLVTGDSHTRLTDYLLDLNLPQNYCIGSNKILYDQLNEGNSISDAKTTLNVLKTNGQRSPPTKSNTEGSKYRRSRRLAARKKLS